MRYLFIYRNSASNKADNFVTNGEQTKELYITIAANLEDLPDGEYNYALVPFCGSDKYYSGMTFDYKGDLLDTVIHCPDGSIMLRYLNPATGIFRIGDIGVTNTYDEGNNKIYFYEG